MLLGASICSGAIGQDLQATRAAQPSVAPPALLKFIQTETSILGQFHLAPIIIPQGERVGDIVDATNATLIASADDCFPSLKPQETPSQLPAIEIASEKELAAALGATASAEASGEVRSGRTFSLDFQDVRVERASVFQLRIALRKDAPECNSIRPFIDATYPSLSKVTKTDKLLVGTRKVIAADRPPPFLVGKIIYAQRVVHVRTAETLAGGVRISFGAQLLKKLGLGSFFEASGSGGDNSANAVDLVGTTLIPVAVAPAFVITSTKKLANVK
jgi:hypothetical protein